MTDRLSRCRTLYGEEGIRTLSCARVAVFGLGGVGGHAAEALVRTGIGALSIFDHDTVDITNLNRQLIATRSTLGMSKVQAALQRFKDIAPDCQIDAHDIFYSSKTADSVDLTSYDYVIDAIDTVTAKLELITRAKAKNVPIVSAMGAGNKTDPTALRIADIYDTSICPLARVMRKELRKRGIEKLKVCYSLEQPHIPTPDSSTSTSSMINNEITEEGGFPSSVRRSTPSSNAFVPAAMGLALAAEVVNDLIARP